MKAKSLILLAVVTLMGVAAAAVQVSQRQPRQHAALPLVIACINTPHSGLLQVAAAKGYFAEEGLAVTLRTVPTGYDAIQAVLKGEADVGAAAETPIARALDEGKPVQVVATIFASRNNVGIVARKDRGILTPANLAGKRIGVVFGTASHYMLETFLAFHDVAIDSVSQVPIKPDVMVSSIVSGEVDAVAAWNPSYAKAGQQLGDNATVFSSGEFYAETYNLAVREGYGADNMTKTEAMMRALVMAERFVAGNVDEAVAIITSTTGTDERIFRTALDPRTYELALNQSTLLATENEARWYLRRGLVKDGSIPDILKAFDTQPLRRVKPAGVSIVK